MRTLPADVRAAFVATRRAGVSFIDSVRGSVNRFGSVTEAQHKAVVEAAARYLARQAERAAEVKCAAPEGRVEIRGKVLKAEWREGFTYNSETLKMIVLVETPAGNFRVWSTVPAALPGDPDVLRGKVIEFTATLKRSDRDEAFAFASRPTKARLVEAAE
jgi:hypothetical protein